MLCLKRDCRRSGAITWPWSAQLDRSEAGSQILCGKLSHSEELRVSSLEARIFAFGSQEADNKRALDLKCWAVILGSGSKLFALNRVVWVLGRSGPRGFAHRKEDRRQDRTVAMRFPGKLKKTSPEATSPASPSSAPGRELTHCSWGSLFALKSP